MGDWKPVTVVSEGQGVIAGINPWRYEWRSVPSEPLELPHPLYRRQRHRFDVYEVDGPEGPVRFAATELSPGCYGFYVPTSGFDQRDSRQCLALQPSRIQRLARRAASFIKPARHD